MALNSREDFLLYKRYIESKGGIEVEYDMTYTHPRIFFKYRGQRRFIVTSKTPSDWRTSQNAKRTINQVFAEIERSTPEEMADDAIEYARAADRADRRAKLPDEHTFGDRVRFVREQLRLSREKLAELSGVDLDIIQVYEVTKADRPDDIDHALKLSTALNTTLAYLAGKAEHEIMSDIGRRISSKRNELNLTIGMLAEATGIPVQQLTNLETGIYPNFQRLGEIAGVLKTSEEYLRTGVGEGESIWTKEMREIQSGETFGAFMRMLRVKANLSQTQLAEKLGQSYPANISTLERGQNTRFILRNAGPLSNVLNVQPEDLINTAERVLANELAEKSIAKVADKQATIEPVFMDPVEEPEPEPAPTTRRVLVGDLVSQRATDLMLEAIQMEARTTRELLAKQHEELLEAIHSAQTSNLADALHKLIDNLLTRPKS